MKKILLLILLVLAISSITTAQTNYRVTPSFESLVGTGENLPFWMTHNQLGKYPINNNPTQLLALEGNITQKNLFNTPLTIEAGTNLISTYSSDLTFQANELFAKAYLWGWKLEAGWFREPEYFNGLSSTNGSLDRSNNARPYPRIRFGTNEFIPFLFWKNWFTFKAEYDEGRLNDERTVEGTRFHHKSLFLKANLTETMALSFGLNHYVMWGGVSPTLGQLPEGFKNYLVYITGSVGTEEFPETDQANVAGNQFGTYLLQYEFSIGETNINLHINHPFEDHGGMELTNARDNLYGIFAQFNQGNLVESLVYEYMYTLHQGGPVHILGSTGMDDYFNHGVYNHGYTYNGYTMASPLFGPLNADLHRLIENTRVEMHHFGIKGHFSDALAWSLKLTNSKFYGTYQNKLLEERKQFSSIFDITYQKPTWPVNLSLSLAADAGELYGNNFGGMIKVSKTFN